MAVLNDLLAAAEAIAPQVIADRRTIHQQPELAFKETATAALVADRLRQLGLEVRTGVAETGVIGLLRGDLPGRTVLLRADMDALPIQEPEGEPFVSRVPGVMHACGHDAHTAILLGAAQLLAERRSQIRGMVKFMFQPAEEIGGSRSGAVRMLEEGVLEDPKVDAAFMLHQQGADLTGLVSLRPGPKSAASDSFTITVRGSGGHGARPQAAVDPVLVAAHIVTAVQSIISREVNPLDAGVVTIGSIHAGTAANVIPATAVMMGTLRAFRPDVRELLQRRLAEIAAGVASALRATVAVEIEKGYPALINDTAMVAVAEEAVRAVVGPDALRVSEPGMPSEDFAYVLERVPGALLGLGVRDHTWDTPRPSHSPEFALDERALPLGVAVMAATALHYLDIAAPE